MHPMALIIRRCRGINLKLDTASELLASLNVCEWSLNLVHNRITLLAFGFLLFVIELRQLFFAKIIAQNSVYT